MELSKNPFAELEADAVCPPNVREELLSEIDFIRNSLTVVEVCTGDFMGAVVLFLELVQNRIDSPPAP
ncbi:hypothetical protein [Tellurirhabdus rosea]|uniref:hypothetical protein n=1 Tax=Tellurirhabdus rosea TaxID=2674997 RepID=UPI002251BF56|nr:hypothetical protein [Tellurirhabdus rosea]